MHKILISLLMMFLTSSLLAATKPTVSLKTDSLGFIFSQPFTTKVVFSEPVVGFGVNDITITNATIISITGSSPGTTFDVKAQPTKPGSIKMSIPSDVVVSQSSGLLNAASNSLSIVALDPNLRPAGNFDLTNWTLTLPLPIGSRDNAITIGKETLNGTPSLNNGYSITPYFHTDPITGAMSFLVPLNGATTPNSDYARSELYEVLPGSSRTWKLSTFNTNRITATVSITRTPPIEKRFVIGQIHDKGNTDIFGHTASNSPLLKLYYDSNTLDPNRNPCNGCVYAQIRNTPSQSNYLKIVNLIRNIPLNTKFIYRLILLKDGSLTIKANNDSTTVKLSTSTNNTIGWGAQQLYFKAGAYNLEHDSVIGGAVNFYSLQVAHT